MAETFFSTLLLMFISARYFVHNARTDTESDTDDTGAYSCSEIQEKKWAKKITFNENM